MELSRGQDATERKDIACITEILANPDKIGQVGKIKIGRETVRNSKRFDETIFLLEEVRSRKSPCGEYDGQEEDGFRDEQCNRRSIPPLTPETLPEPEKKMPPCATDG